MKFPLAVVVQSTDPLRVAVVDADAQIVANVAKTEDAPRIVSCLTACQGFDVPELAVTTLSNDLSFYKAATDAYKSAQSVALQPVASDAYKPLVDKMREALDLAATEMQRLGASFSAMAVVNTARSLTP